jgi:hypothetical protein
VTTQPLDLLVAITTDRDALKAEHGEMSTMCELLTADVRAAMKRARDAEEECRKNVTAILVANGILVAKQAEYEAHLRLCAAVRELLEHLRPLMPTDERTQTLVRNVTQAMQSDR